MKRHGFALLTVLWVTAALSAIVAASLALAGTGSATSRNRIVLTRGAWAREACVEILLARYAGNPSIRKVDTVELGRGVWCRAELTNAAATLDLNLATPEAVRALVENDSLADALLDWRDADDIPRPLGAESDWYRAAGRRLPRNGPLADVGELSRVRGFDSADVARLATLLTTDGTGQLDLNAAPAALLATLPGLGPEALAVFMRRRSTGTPVVGIDQFLALLPPAGRSSLLAHYQEFTRQAVYAAPLFMANVEGGVRGAVPVSRAVLTLVPAAGRLAVIRRRTQ
jgi:general secretion pathway protein K